VGVGVGVKRYRISNTNGSELDSHCITWPTANPIQLGICTGMWLDRIYLFNCTTHLTTQAAALSA